MAVVILFLMMLLIVVDVIGRYFFDSPTYVADEISGYALVAIVFLAVANTQRLGKHMVVTVVTTHLSSTKRKWLELSTNIISLSFLIWFTWSTTMGVLESYNLQSVSHGVINTPYWIPKLLLPIGLSLFSMQIFLQLFRHIILWKQGVKTVNKTDVEEELTY